MNDGQKADASVILVRNYISHIGLFKLEFSLDNKNSVT